MKLTADRDGHTRFFSIKLGWKEHFDPKEIEMLSAGAVPMLIVPAAVQGRKNNIIKYNISSYSTLEFYLSCILSREQFGELLLQCIDVFRNMQRVYLNYKNLVLDLNQIYILLGDRSIHFIYIPLMGGSRDASIPAFFRSVIQKASRSTYEQVSFLDGCLAWLNRPASFSLDEFESFVRGGAVLQTVSAVPPAAVSNQMQSERVYRPIPPKEPSVLAQGPGSFQGNTSRLNEPCGGTVLLGEAEHTTPAFRYFLLRAQTDEKIEITHSPFLVGTELGSVSYCISDNAAISRRHAEFIVQADQCTIADQKSTNKTYVNDCALTPLLARQLENGDRIRLANETFTFVQEAS